MWYEIWKAPDDSEINMSDEAGIADLKAKGLIGDDWVFMYRYEAADWNGANTRYHELMGWKPYEPMLDED